MVECGACDQKFKVEDSALVRQKKHYPGEKSESNAQIFAKSPDANPKKHQDVAFQTANYQNVSADHIQPPKPLKTLMIAIGAIAILFFIALFLLGGREGGMLKGLDNSKRLILASFIALAGSALILAGSRKKSKGLLASFILGGSLIAMPFLFPEVIDDTIAEQPNEIITVESKIEDENSYSVRLEKYKNGIGFGKIEASRIQLADPSALKAIVLRDSKIQDIDPILSYLENATEISSSPVTYTFGRELEGRPVTLITFISDTPLERVFDLTKKFGVPQEMNDIRTALKVIEVIVDRTTLLGQPSALTNDPNHRQYFDANYLELRSIDRNKQLNAAKRLETSADKGRQSDIATALANLINTRDHELSRQAISTLNQWTIPEYKTDQRVIDYAKKIAGTENMSRAVMNYLTDRDVPGSEEILSKQWASPKGHLIWANYLIKANKRGEKALIKALPNVDKNHYRSAITILRKIGTVKSISTINSVLSKANEEDKKYFKAVVDEIKSRQ